MNVPTKEQKELHKKVAEIGCMVCYNYDTYTPCQIHHGKDYSTYRNHWFVYGLCPVHHHKQHEVAGIPNRHGNRKQFEKECGTDQELHEQCMKILGEKTWKERT